MIAIAGSMSLVAAVLTGVVWGRRLATAPARAIRDLDLQAEKRRR